MPPLPPLIDDLPLAYRFRPAQGSDRGLVILLHGVGSNEASMAALGDLLPADLAVALVRSPIAMGPSAYCAFAVSFTANGPVIDAAAAEQSRQTMIRFVGELQARTGIAPDRTLVAGFSQGGIMSAGIALTRPDLVAGFAILSGRILPEITPHIAAPDALARLRALVLHGEADGTLPVFWAERSVTLLRDLGVRFEAKRYAARHEITTGMADEFVTWVNRSLR